MRMESESGIVRPGQKQLDGGATGDGECVIRVAHEGKTIVVYLTPEEIEAFGTGLIGAAAVERFLAQQTKRAIAPAVPIVAKGRQ